MAPVLRLVVLPDLSRVDASVGAQLRERHAFLADLLTKPNVPDAEKAAAFGSVAVLFHAAEYYEAAEPAYLNAQALAPKDAKWPYLLAHLRKSLGQPAEAVAAFTRALELAPGDVPALVWLGRMYLDQGSVDKAEPLFERARAVAPRTPAVLLGLGQSALARRDYGRAASVLEAALRIDPTAASVRSPLAMAYRGLGDTRRAEDELRQWKSGDVRVPDPLLRELELALQSGLSFEQRGVRALEARDFLGAASFFRQGIDVTDGETPLGRSLRHKLGTALYMGGDVRGAVQLFRETVRRAPQTGQDDPVAKAHYSLGILMASAGLQAKAIEHLSASVRFSPNYLEALLALADALRRAGRVQDSLAAYQDALQVNPRSVESRVGYGLALVRLGRFLEARRWFEDAVAVQPDESGLAHFTARLLVAAPDARARDGARGLVLVQKLLANAERTTSLGETLAMALAETGDYTQAAGIQRGVLAAARKAGLSEDVRRMTRNLRLFEQKRPCREPWPVDDPVHFPGPAIDPLLRQML